MQQKNSLATILPQRRLQGAKKTGSCPNIAQPDGKLRQTQNFEGHTPKSPVCWQEKSSSVLIFYGFGMVSIDALFLLKGIAVPLWFALVWSAEYAQNLRLLFSQRALARWGRNIGLALLNVAAGPAIVILTRLATQNTLDWRPEISAPFSAMEAICEILFLDFAIYVWHAMNHQIPFLWRFHQVHHLDGDLDSTTALRFHIGEVLLSAFFRAGIIILFDIGLATVILAEICLQFFTIFHHSKLNLPRFVSRPLGWLIIVPEMHRVHHNEPPHDTNSNYGNILSVWDRLFGTFNSPTPERQIKFGIAGKADRGFVKLMLYPFADFPKSTQK